MISLSKVFSLCVLGLYFTGDRAKQTPDKYYQLEGRLEDFLDLKGTRISPAEMEMEMVRVFLVGCAAEF